MKNIIKTLTASLILSSSISMANTYEDKFLNGDNPELNTQEKKALSIYDSWSSDNKNASMPAYGNNGGIAFSFGASQPSIVCAVMQICDLALEAGETINSVNIGDSARWNIEPAITGSGSNQIQHLIIKPLDVGLNTSMVITTDRRTYHIRLKSHRTQYMPSVYFRYPEDTLKKWQSIQTQRQQHEQREVLPDTGQRITDLDFEYTLSGSASWKPLRVYNDGNQTIIVMPKNLSQMEAPALLVIRGKDQLNVNYRIINDRYIVDSIFDKAILITGSGSGQTKVTINRKK